MAQNRGLLAATSIKKPKGHSYVYIVEQGHGVQPGKVLGVFSNRAKARRFCIKHTKDWNGGSGGWMAMDSCQWNSSIGTYISMCPYELR